MQPRKTSLLVPMIDQSKRPLQFIDKERRSILLLVSIVLLFTLAPILENYATGGLLLILNLYITLAAATSKLAEEGWLFRIAIPIAIASMILLLASHYYPTRPLLFTNYL